MKLLDSAVQWIVGEQQEERIVTEELCGVEYRAQTATRHDRKRAASLINEEPVIEWLFQNIDESTVFWDIGAFHGHYSMIAELLGATALAFEPNDENRKWLLKNMCLNGLEFRVPPVALSDQVGRSRFQSNSSESKKSLTWASI